MSTAFPDVDSLNTSGVTLPAYVVLRPGGVYLSLSPPLAQDILRLFVDRLFSSEARFEGLDYGRFLQLLYGVDTAPPLGNATEVRIASAIVRFPPERLALYKGVKFMNNGERAVYMFDQPLLKVLKEEPVYGEPGADGVKPIIEYRHSIETRATQLDFDEFVASMWLKGVRFGIDADVVRDAIKKRLSTRINIAYQLAPTDSKDAEVVEESDHLRQDNAPLILPNGKADLRRARNRFPQVAMNTPLLRKIPSATGQPGYRVTGTPIPPRTPKDLDFGKLAGEGTRIDEAARGEVLVANMDGFVVIDRSTGEIWITPKIVNKSGISAKSTGDITLTVDEFTEHGEVQEGRIVEGKHMTFRSDVYGMVISQGGNIEIDKNLSGGSTQSFGGNITVKGKTINATLEAEDGSISTDFAEGCVVIGKSVTIGRAVNCEIVAEELHLDIGEGCAIAGKCIRINSLKTRKYRENVVSILLPDVASYDGQIAAAMATLAQVEQILQAKQREIAATQKGPGFSKYLLIAEKVRKGTITFTPEQQAEWQKIVSQYAPVVRGTDGFVKRCMELEETIRKLSQERDTCSMEESCEIAEISGELVVRKIISNLGVSLFRDMSLQELRTKLHDLGAARERIFSGNGGSFEWRFTMPPKPVVQV